MSHDWMIELLTDIRNVAHKHALVGLAEHLDDAVVLAAREMRELPQDPELTSVHVRANGEYSWDPVGRDLG